MSHDQVNRFLRRSCFSPSQLRELVQPLLTDSPEAFLLLDDSVQDKRYNRFIEVAKHQYSGNEHGLVTGICLVNLVHSSGEPGDFLLSGVGVATAICPADSPNDLPGPSAAVGTLSAATIGPTPHSRTITCKCVSPMLYSGFASPKKFKLNC